MPPIGLIATMMLMQVAQSPTPQTPPQTWVTPSDYRPGLRQYRGRTVVVLAVDTEGRVTSCEIKVSSGSTALDNIVCDRARERGRFTPARDDRGAAISASYVFPVLWGRPDIVIEPSSVRRVIALDRGRAVSCRDDRSEHIETDSSKCTVSREVLERFGSDYLRATELTIDSVILAGDTPILRPLTDARRLILVEKVVKLDVNGRVETCSSRLAVSQTLEDCVGYPLDRRFTGPTIYTTAVDWTLSFPSSDEAEGQEP